MIYGIEQTTDMRYPDTAIQKFRTQASAVRWRNQKDNGFAWPGAADPKLPVGQQNFHRRLRRLYEMPPGWRPPSSKALSKEASRSSTPTYPRYTIDMLANAIKSFGEELNDVEN